MSKSMRWEYERSDRTFIVYAPTRGQALHRIWKELFSEVPMLPRLATEIHDALRPIGAFDSDSGMITGDPNPTVLKDIGDRGEKSWLK